MDDSDSGELAEILETRSVGVGMHVVFRAGTAAEIDFFLVGGGRGFYA